MKRPAAVAFFSAAVVTALLTGASMSYALLFSRQPALTCRFDEGVNGAFANYAHAYAKTGAMEMLCPYAETSYFPKTSAATGYFYFTTDHPLKVGDVGVHDCDTYSTAVGGICGCIDENVANQNGPFTLKDPPSCSWQHQGFAWYSVYWNQNATNQGVSFAGYRITDETFTE